MMRYSCGLIVAPWKGFYISSLLDPLSPSPSPRCVRPTPGSWGRVWPCLTLPPSWRPWREICPCTSKPTSTPSSRTSSPACRPRAEDVWPGLSLLNSDENKICTVLFSVLINVFILLSLCYYIPDRWLPPDRLVMNCLSLSISFI